MKTTLKSILLVPFFVCLLSSITIRTAFATGNSQIKVITGFKPLSTSQSLIEISVEEKTTIANAVALMPNYLDVYLDGNSNPESIPVSWFCISDDYEESEYYYYQFSPKFDESRYSLNPSIELLTDAPYIAVFIIEGENEIATLDYANGSDSCIYQGNEYYCNYDDEYKLYVLDQKANSEHIALNKHIGAILSSKNMLYVLAFDEDQSSSLIRYNMNTSMSETILNLSGLINSMARRGSMLYLATSDGIAQLNLNSLALSQLIGGFEVSLVYFSDPDTLRYYTKDGELRQISFTEDNSSSDNDYDEIFLDVNASSYYYDAVLWAVSHGITKGKTDTSFDPSGSCTRAQMVTFLWRYAGCPAPSSINPFADVNNEAYYYNAVIWAVEQGITNGKTNNFFSPNESVSRAQAITFLYRMCGSVSVDSNNPFSDVVHNSYYEDAVSWGVKESITNGKSSTIFAPNDYCSRAQIVTLLYRLNSSSSH